MSLILEALKKLERDRHTHERGFLVLAAPADAPPARSWTRPAVLAAAAAVGGAALAALVLRAAPADSTASAVPASPLATVRPLAAAATVDTRSRSAPQARVAWPPASGGGATKPAATARPEQPHAAARPPDELPAAAAETPADDPPAEEGEAPAPPETPAAGPAAPLRLEAISQRDGQPVAVISGQVVRAGDRVGASTVVRIGAGEVELETGGVRRVLRF